MMMLLLGGIAAADSLDYESQTAVLSAETVLYVEILGVAEALNWYGEGGITLTAPDSTTTTLSQSGSFFPWSLGTWQIELHEDQPVGWDIHVSGTTDGTTSGRVYSYTWHLSSGAEPIYDRFYVPIPQTSDDPLGGTVQINKLYAEGLLGDEIRIAASRTGLASTPGYSSPDGPTADLLPVFLERPGFLNDGVSSGVSTASDVRITYDLDCEQVVPGYGGVEVSFTTNGHGQPMLVCDLNEDNIADYSSVDDLTLLGEATPEHSAITWDGLNVFGGDLDVSGTLTCITGLNTLPMHALVHGAWVASPGVRVLHSISDSASPGLTMHWNDTALGTSMVTEDGDPSLLATGADGVFSDDIYNTGVICAQGAASYCSAHSWGTVDLPDTEYAAGWVDTWTFDTRLIADGSFSIEVGDLEEDPDIDDLPSSAESCLIGTDPELTDTDDDGLTDGEEVDGSWDEPPDTDGDDLIDALDEDDDGDSIPTRTELKDTLDADLDSDLDGDGASNWHDTDADADGIPDSDEPDDADGSGIPDYLEPAGEDTGTHPGLTGDFRGGACQCAAVGGGQAGIFSGALVLLVALRRRQ